VIEYKQRNNLFYQIILFISFVIAYIYIFDVKLDLNGDNFEYLNLAKSIIGGNGYSFPYNANNVPANWFPPGYPAIIAFFMSFSGNNIIVFKIVNGLFFIGSVLLFYNVIENTIKVNRLAFSICLLIVLNSGLLRFSTIIMSEMAYLFFSVLTIYYVLKIKEEAVFWKSKYLYLLILFASAAFYIRSIGIVLALSIALFWIIEKRWKIALVFLSGFTLLYIPWFIRNSLLEVKSRYLGTIMSVNAWRPELGRISSVGDFITKMKINFYDLSYRVICKIRPS
jgi:hypothetical protein